MTADRKTGKTLWMAKTDQGRNQFFFCQGEGACRGFVIMSVPVRKMVLDTWNNLDLTAVDKMLSSKYRKWVEEAQKLLVAKAEHPTFDSIEYCEQV